MAVALLIAAGAAQAQTTEADPVLALSVSDAVVTVTLTPGAERQVRAYRENDGARIEVELERVAEEQRRRTFLRPVAAVDAPGALSVEVVLDPDVPLSIDGDRLSLSLTDSRDPSAASSARPAAGYQRGGTAFVELIVRDSSVSVEGAREVMVNAVASDVWTARTMGMLMVSSSGGSLTVSGHQGNLTLTSDGARQRVEDFTGAFAVKLDNCDLTARRWSAKGQASFLGSALDLEQFEGDLQLNGESSSLAIRQLSGASLDLQGGDLQATLEAVDARFTALLEGGALRLEGYRGEARVTGDGTVLDLAGGEGKLILTLQSGSDAAVREFAGLLRAELVDSALDVDGVGILTFNASGGRIGAREVGQLNAVTATGAELDLDLKGVSKVAAMSLAGATRARIELSAPCVVRTLGSQGLPGEAAEVTGCDLEVPDQAPTRLHAKRRYGGQATVLNVEVGEGAELSVEGR